MPTYLPMSRYLTRMRLLSLLLTAAVAVAVATLAGRVGPPPTPASPATIRANEDSPELERAGAKPDFDQPPRPATSPIAPPPHAPD